MQTILFLAKKNLYTELGKLLKFYPNAQNLVFFVFLLKNDEKIGI